MTKKLDGTSPLTVALRKESVDRNRCDVAVADQLDGRSPQGERGKKKETLEPKLNQKRSLTARRAWIEIRRG